MSRKAVRSRSRSRWLPVNCQTTMMEAKISMSESRPNPARATERARTAAQTTKPTTHDQPTYVVDGVIHYAVANMPGGVPRTSTLALTNATFPYAKKLARLGWKVSGRPRWSRA